MSRTIIKADGEAVVIIPEGSSALVVNIKQLAMPLEDLIMKKDKTAVIPVRGNVYTAIQLVKA